MKDELYSEVERVQGLMLTAAALLLVTAWINATLLVLIRLIGRTREFAIRTAIGESPIQRVRALCGETCILFVVAALGGIALASSVLRAAEATFTESLGGLPRIAVSSEVVGSAIVASVILGVLASVVPLWQIRRTNVALVLASGSPRAVVGHRSLDWLAAAQVGCVTFLLLSATYAVQQLRTASTVALGFDDTGLLAGELFLGHRYATDDQRASAWSELAREITADATHPTAFSTSLTPSAGESVRLFLPDGPSLRVLYRPVSTDYFRLLGIRTSEAGSAEDISKDVRVNRAFVKQYFGNGTSPIGKNLFFSVQRVPSESWRVVGVVDDVVESGSLRAEPTVYTDVFRPGRMPDRVWILRRQTDSMTSEERRLRQAVQRIDPMLSVRVVSFHDRLAQRWQRTRLVAWVLVVFVFAAGGIALMGVYAAVRHVVASRLVELSVRLALGGRRAVVAGQLLRRLTILTVVGMTLAVGWSPIGWHAVDRAIESPQPMGSLHVLFAIVLVGLASLVAALPPLLGLDDERLYLLLRSGQ